MTTPSTLTNDFDKKLYLALNKELMPRLVKNTPFKTGNTAAMWEIRRKAPFTYELVNKNGLVALFLEEGTRGHDITPSEKKMMRFPMKVMPSFRTPADKKQFDKNGQIWFWKNGHPILGFKKEQGKIFCYTKHVKHPGFQGRHYIKKTVEDESLWNAIKKQIA